MSEKVRKPFGGGGLIKPFKGAFKKYVRSEGEGGGLTKANIPYKNCHFPYMKSEQGVAKLTKIERTYFLNAP